MLASQLTFSAAKPLMVGGSVCDVRAIVHLGAEGSDCHSTLTLAGALAPVPFRAITEYVTDPTLADVALHCAAALVQFVHVYATGAFVHDAVSMTVSPTCADALDAETMQSGTAAVAAPPGEHIATGMGGGP